MRGILLLCFQGCFALAGCSDQRPTLDVSVNGLTGDVRSLQVRTWLNGRESAGEPWQVRRRLERFLVALPVAAFGQVKLSVGGMAANGCQVVAGEAPATVAAAGTYPVSVTLVGGPDNAGCGLAVDRYGDSPGRVFTRDGGLTCAFGGEPPGPPCERRFDLGTQIELLAEADEGFYAGSYFAGWTGACSGQGPAARRSGTSRRGSRRPSCRRGSAPRTTSAGRTLSHPLI